MYGIFNKLIFSLLVLSNLSWTTELEKDFYQKRAIEFLNKVRQVNSEKTLNKEKLIEYLGDRILKSQEVSYKESEEVDRFLDTEWVFIFVLNYLDSDPEARAIYYFPFMAQENLAFLLRKKLGCYVNELQDFEKDYSTPLQKVSDKEFGSKLNELKKGELDLLLLQISNRYAKEILEQLELESNNEVEEDDLYVTDEEWIRKSK